MRFLRLTLMLVCVDVSAQQCLPLREHNGQIVILVTDHQYKPHKFTLDTGACISVVYDLRLLDDVVRSGSTLFGVGGKEITVEYCGRLALNFIEAYAYYIEHEDTDVDGILGVDWMIQHRAKVDLERMILEYY